MSEEIIKCPKCGKENSIDEIYCANCGKDLTKKEKVKKEYRPSSGRDALSYFICSTLFACIIGFLVCMKFGLIIEDLAHSDNALQQIYTAIELVSAEVGICIGIVIAFVVILFIRINEKLNDITMKLSKYNNNKEN